MPKDRQQCHSLVSRKARKSFHHPYDSPSRNPDTQGSTSKDGELDAQKQEWEDARCPICIEHPHNVVLLLCSSYDQGCRPYMCDTSYRHSNCLDQYRKRKENWKNILSQGVEVYNDSPGGEALNLRSLQNLDEDMGLGGRGRHRRGQSSSWRQLSGEFQETHSMRTTQNQLELPSERIIDGLPRMNATPGGQTENIESTMVHGNENEVTVNEGLELKCPLCRGSVTGWKVVEDARHYLNLKIRSCSRESCSFNGTYEELRKHARSIHPTTRPADTDPSRQRAWRRLEHQRDYGDVLSTIRSAMPNAVVLGDYVIDSEDGMPLDEGMETDPMSMPGSWWTTFFFFRMIGASREDARGLPARWRASSRQHTSSRMRGHHPNLWGENYIVSGNEESDNFSGNSSTGQRRRRRLNRGARPDGELP